MRLAPLFLRLGLPPRFSVTRKLGQGGTSVVFEVQDKKLDRQLALKVLRSKWVSTLDAQERFRREAIITASLDHPGIISVIDHGTLTDGRPWMVMARVQGQPFRALLGDPEGHTRCLRILARVADAVAAAHAAGIVHRDLKPDNVMVGVHGEVLVMDWGSAVRAGQDQVAGGSTGTLPYMAPEGEFGAGPPASGGDVYALGVILHEVLYGRRPSMDEAEEPTSLPPSLQGSLEALCWRAMEEDPQCRPTTQAFAQAIEDWLDGSTKRAQAASLLSAAHEKLRQAEVLELRCQALRQEADGATVQGDARTPQDHAPAWSLQDHADALADDAATLRAEALASAQGALTLDPDGPARSWLLRYHREALLRAEAVGDRRAQRHHEATLKQYDHDGTQVSWLGAPAVVELRTTPTGATVQVFRVTGDRLPSLAHVTSVGPTPTSLRLPSGRYVLAFSKPGFHEVRYPAVLGRGQRWPRPAPGELHPRPLRMLPEGSLRPSQRYVAAGWTPIGGDPDALDSLGSSEVWVDGFVMQRDPVTHAEYLTFLNDIAPDEAMRHAPRDPLRARSVDAQHTLMVVDGRWSLPEDVHPDSPVVLISLYDAWAYCRWLAAREGVPWRLPTGLEWERAARGVDRRRWPWGDHFHPTWTNMVLSRDPPGPVPVGDCLDDVSPWGVRGLGGNARDWCATVWRPDFEGVRCPGPEEPSEDNLYEVRGGSWNSRAGYCRAAARWADRPGARYRNIGFRVMDTSRR
ncbi:MAG: SUMF1/EgtB/PvdO family nonheme iron enzyme [Alphaproteobacteria bacterium]|nr:SUMF1/EgtB/PvdO family nonheme iron enzyme [Alphaproteobacteria bacterium]